MEIIISSIFVLALLFMLFQLLNSRSFSDPTNTDVIEISKIDREKLSKYPDVCLLSNKFSISTFSRSNRENIKKVRVYSVCLLSINHRNKIKIAGFKNKEEAKRKMIFISEEYSKNIVKYNPQITSRKGRR